VLHAGSNRRWSLVKTGSARHPTVPAHQWILLTHPYSRRDECVSLGLPRAPLSTWRTTARARAQRGAEPALETGSVLVGNELCLSRLWIVRETRRGPRSGWALIPRRRLTSGSKGSCGHWKYAFPTALVPPVVRR
jgi:hypothetical protein